MIVHVVLKRVRELVRERAYRDNRCGSGRGSDGLDQWCWRNSTRAECTRWGDRRTAARRVVYVCALRPRPRGCGRVELCAIAKENPVTLARGGAASLGGGADAVKWHAEGKPWLADGAGVAATGGGPTASALAEDLLERRVGRAREAQPRWEWVPQAL